MARPFDDEPFQLAFVVAPPERQNAPAVTARAARRGLRAIVLSPQQLRQFSEVGGDAPGLVGRGSGFIRHSSAARTRVR